LFFYQVSFNKFIIDVTHTHALSNLSQVDGSLIDYIKLSLESYLSSTMISCLISDKNVKNLSPSLQQQQHSNNIFDNNISAQLAPAPAIISCNGNGCTICFTVFDLTDHDPEP
jgi:hypothetical protein